MEKMSEIWNGKKDLELIKSPIHCKLHNCYEAGKFLVEDVQEEALQGAPPMTGLQMWVTGTGTKGP